MYNIIVVSHVSAVTVVLLVTHPCHLHPFPSTRDIKGGVRGGATVAPRRTPMFQRTKIVLLLWSGGRAWRRQRGVVGWVGPGCALGPARPPTASLGQGGWLGPRPSQGVEDEAMVGESLQLPSLSFLFSRLPDIGGGGRALEAWPVWPAWPEARLRSAHCEPTRYMIRRLGSPLVIVFFFKKIFLFF